MAPKRLRRQPANAPERAVWDSAAVSGVLDDVGAKRSRAGPLLRSLVAKFVEGAHSKLWESASAPGGSPGAGNPQEVRSEVGWADLAVTEDLVAAAGMPVRSACALLATTSPACLRPRDRRTSADGSTTKLVFELRDGHHVETVVMRHEGRTTVCVSSQVGCQMGCAFCATGTMPTVGDLDATEIVEQLLHAHAMEVADGRAPVKNAVFMGMGEPLNNYAAVISALRTLTDNGAMGKYHLPASRVTVSTVGVVPRMLQLATDAPAVNLALSLHAPTQELREKIVPSAKQSPLEDLLRALDEHAATCRRHTPTSVAAMVEYVLLAGVNDTDECAVQLADLMAPRSADVMVNLIPYNPGASSVEGGFQAPEHGRVERFQQIVASRGVFVRVRREMGRDIAGACGQLALATGREGPAAPSPKATTDLEDFVAWRRRQPREAKAAVHEDCAAVASGAARAEPGGYDARRRYAALAAAVTAASAAALLIWAGRRR